MSEYTIVEAAVVALKKLNKPATLRQIYNVILGDGLYKFGAKEPLTVLRIQIERHSVTSTWAHKSKTFYFTRLENGEYSLLDQDTSIEPEVSLSEPNIFTSYHIHQLSEKLKQQTVNKIINHLYSLTPEEFEQFSQKFLASYGFEDMEVTKKGRDGGIDVFGFLEVGISKLHVAAQCKRYKLGNKVSRPDISQFRGDIQGEYQQGIFITTSEFTQEAKDTAVKAGCVPIVLIDGQTLAEIMIDKEIGVNVRSIPIYDFEVDLL